MLFRIINLWDTVKYLDQNHTLGNEEPVCSHSLGKNNLHESQFI